MKKLWLELDISGTLGDDAWIDIDRPKGYVEGAIINDPSQRCTHSIDAPHAEGEWKEVWVTVEDLHAEDAIRFYKEKERILSVEVED